MFKVLIRPTNTHLWCVYNFARIDDAEHFAAQCRNIYRFDVLVS